MSKLLKIKFIKSYKKFIFIFLFILISFFIYLGYYPKNVDNLYLCNFIINGIKKQECIANVAQNLEIEKAVGICSNLKDAFIKDACFLNLIKPPENLLTGNLNETRIKINQENAV
jgi:hypothetical protein